MEIILEHVRSFSKKCNIPLRPLTLLVGENSSGKSTFLATISSILDGSGFPFSPRFNEPPYNLGTFDTIATYRGGKYGRDEHFSIGFSVPATGKQSERTVMATYGSEYGNIALRQMTTSTADGRLELDISDKLITGHVSFTSGRNKNETEYDFKIPINEASRFGQNPFRFLMYEAVPDRTGAEKPRQLREPEMEALFRLAKLSEPPYGTSYSFAPIRSKPRRTYDELSEEYTPEGDHIPTLLARLLRQEAASPDSDRVVKSLQRFGKESGLFKNINVKKLGKKATDPFQLQVAGVGPPVNLTDVGYGVSQALPIIVQSVLKATSKVLLMQQPEVHLHPRAQAALGSFFAELAADDDRIIVMETHSDYLVDRVRQEIAQGTIEAERVLIVFFHKPGLDTDVHPIHIDSRGNVEDAPHTYREFFLNEEVNLFSRTET
jgi:energy-coupling factor transporter ATP-binding protein EcfA2